jgi:hypothetical protein
MTYALKFRVNALPPMNTASSRIRGRHWSAIKRTRDQWRQVVALAVRDAGGPPQQPLRRASIHCVRCSASAQGPDLGNLAESFKPILDALLVQPRGCGVLLDDGPRVLPYCEQTYEWRHAPRGHGAIEIEIAELPLFASTPTRTT